MEQIFLHVNLGDKQLYIACLPPESIFCFIENKEIKILPVLVEMNERERLKHLIDIKQNDDLEQICEDFIQENKIFNVMIEEIKEIENFSIIKFPLKNLFELKEKLRYNIFVEEVKFLNHKIKVLSNLDNFI